MIGRAPGSRGDMGNLGRLTPSIVLRQEGLLDVVPHQKDRRMVLLRVECRGVSVPITLGLILRGLLGNV